MLTRETAEGRPETGQLAADNFFRVTGDGHQGISLSGVRRSAFGSRLQVSAVAMGRADRPRSAAVERGAQPYQFPSQSSALRFPLAAKFLPPPAT